MLLVFVVIGMDGCLVGVVDGWIQTILCGAERQIRAVNGYSLWILYLYQVAL